MDEQEMRSGPSTPADLSARSFQRTDMEIGAATATGAGTDTMTLTGTASPPWPNTAFTLAQETGAQIVAGGAAPYASTSPSAGYAHTPLNYSMPGPTPQHTFGIPVSFDGAQLQTPGAGPSVVPPNQEMMMHSPLGGAFEAPGSQLPPTMFTTPGPFDSSFCLNTSQQDQFQAAGTQRQDILSQQYPGMISGFPNGPYDYAMMGNLALTNEIMGQEPVGNCNPLSTAMQRIDQQGGHSDVHGQSLASPNTLDVMSESGVQSNYQESEGRVMSGLSIAQATTEAGDTAQVIEHVSRSGQRMRSTLLRTGQGRGIYMYNPEFSDLSAHSPYGENPAQGTSAAAVQGPVSPQLQQARATNKGKGKLVLRTKGEQPSHSMPSNDPSPSSPKKRGGVFKRIKKLLKRASLNRPTTIVCPFMDCGETFANLHGTIEQHVQICRAHEVQALRDAQVGGSQTRAKPAKPPATIRCPTCQGRAIYSTLDRWEKHLKQKHGEWITYQCEVPGCDARFLSMHDRNEHMRSEH